ncbi:DUF1097 domain-containing protein [Vibrio sp.]|uniref:DUF1097 domain-containing protein n=1 Tax=Vibrio sp. TaxID=678 RepID=UPI003D1513F0
MNALFAISLTTGILSGIWGWIAISFGLLSWAGFLGCTSYFATPHAGLKGLAQSLCCNLSGVFWAWVMILLSQFMTWEIIGYVITAFAAFMMCIQAKNTLLAYIPGTFIGCCATFAADGNIALVIPSLLLGGVFGYTMKASGEWLHKRSEERKESEHGLTLRCNKKAVTPQ